MDCGKIVSPSNKVRVTSECRGSHCNGSIYKWSLAKLNNVSHTWTQIPILPKMTLTSVNTTNMILKPNALTSSSKFKLMLVVTSQSGSEGFGVVEFETAGSPTGGYCMPSTSEGVALETEFTFECFGWQGEGEPLTYEFRHGDDPISYGSSPTSVSTVLPAGRPENDHQLLVRIIIKNSVGVAVEETLFVKVRKNVLKLF